MVGVERGRESPLLQKKLSNNGGNGRWRYRKKEDEFVIGDSRVNGSWRTKLEYFIWGLKLIFKLQRSRQGNGAMCTSKREWENLCWVKWSKSTKVKLAFLFSFFFFSFFILWRKKKNSIFTFLVSISLNELKVQTKINIKHIGGVQTKIQFCYVFCYIFLTKLLINIFMKVKNLKSHNY